MFKPIYDKNQPNVELVWMVRHGGLTNSYSEDPVNYGELLASGDITDDWDEDAEDYVTLANPKNNPLRQVIWTDPYYDTVGAGWLVSCIAPIYRDSEFIGTVGIDLQLNVILDTVLDITMYKSGHAFLIDDTGNTIAHKDLDYTRQLQMNSNPDDIDVNIEDLESESMEFKSLLNKMTTTESGIETVTYSDGMTNYIGFERITGTNFILGIVVQEAEVIESVDDTKKSIEETTNETMYLVLVINAVAIVFILIVGLSLSNRIIAPINEMIEVSRQLAVGEIDVNLFKSANSKISKRKTK